MLDAALRFPEAAAAYTRAAALDPAGRWSATRQLSEKLAAARPPYPTVLLQQLYQRATAEGRVGDALQLAAPLQKTAQETLPLWQAKVDAWLGKNSPKLEIMKDGTLFLRIADLGITDLFPLAGMPLTYFSFNHTLVSDLTPLIGMRLTTIGINDTQVRDISPLRDMPLKAIDAGGLKSLTDISALRNAPLTFVRIEGSGISDISPLAGKQLDELRVGACAVTDFSILRGMPVKEAALNTFPNANPPDLVEIVMTLTKLETLYIEPTVRDFEKLRTHPTLKRLGRFEYTGVRPVAEFWKTYDAKKAAGPK